ncbi:MAG: CYTH domain-containing protein [Thermotogae bacterium]|nr:CYTH domain-containing protein [Thermotogota bacterium]
MEIEAKFRINGREDLERILSLLKKNGYSFQKERKVRYTDVYYDPGDGGALRFRLYEDGRIVRTYKKDVDKEGGVVVRQEDERDVTIEDMRREVFGKIPILESITHREIYSFDGLKLTYDRVIYGDDTEMLFLEIEGDEKTVKRLATLLEKSGYTSENRSKLAIGLALKGNGRA